MPEIKDSRGNRWLTTCIFHDKEPLKIIKKLNENQIESRPLWKPMHLQPVFKNAKRYVNGVSERLFKKGICLPSPTAISNEEISKICELIRN